MNSREISYFSLPPPRRVPSGSQVYDEEDENSCYNVGKTPSFLHKIFPPPSEFADNQNGTPLGSELYIFSTDHLGTTDELSGVRERGFTAGLHSYKTAGLGSLFSFAGGYLPYIPAQREDPPHCVGTMGWGQPNVGKRCRDDNVPVEHHSGYLASESETDDELRAHLMNKRSRDVSPVRSTPGVTDLTNGDYKSSEDAATESSETGIGVSCEPSSSVLTDALGSTSLISTTRMTLPRQQVSGDVSESDDEDECALLAMGVMHPQGVRGHEHLGTAVSYVAPGPSQQKSFMRPVTRKRLIRRKPADTMVVSKEKGGFSPSSTGSSINEEGDFQGSPTRSVPKYRGPRVPASRTPRRKNLSPTLSKATKNLKHRTVATPKDEDEEEEEEFELGLAEDDGAGLKDDEAVEDDASTSTDITLPNVVRNIVPPIRPSYFPFVPPYLNFCLHDEKSEVLPAEIRKHLKWRMSTITPVVIRKTVANSGFRMLKKTVEWGGQWGKHMKGAMFRSTLKDYQKLNHLPATFQLGRKDRLWKNVYRFILKFGKTQYGFLPRTYILPHDIKQLKYAWDASESKGKMWIVKPPAGARGTGIRVINKWNQVPKKRPMIVQQYISKPLLINDRKFDLRLYVLVTNFHPLRVYLYNDGLVRFAPVKYSHDSKRVSDRYMHLTNYSVNKNCDLYTQNEDANACKGHKWTLKALWRYLRGQGVDTQVVLRRIEDIIIKTLISAEECITASVFHMPNRYNGYELFGFDIILDESFKPWLLEVNISPSLHSSSPLDLAVKGPLVKEVFNIVGYHLPPLLPKQARKMFMERLDKQLELEKPTFDKRIYTNLLSKEEKAKQQVFKGKFDDRSQYLKEIIETLTPDDIRHLIIAEDELSQCQGFCRIFPTRHTHAYFGFLEGSRYYNMLMDAWENKYGLDRAVGIVRLQELCRRKIHLSTVPVGAQPTSGENPDDICDQVDPEDGMKASGDSATGVFPAVSETVDKSTSGPPRIVPMLTKTNDEIEPASLFEGAPTQLEPVRSIHHHHHQSSNVLTIGTRAGGRPDGQPNYRPAPVKVDHYMIMKDDGGCGNLRGPVPVSEVYGSHHMKHLPPARNCLHSLPDESRLSSNLMSNSNTVTNNNGSAPTPNVNEYNKIKGVCY